MICILIFRFLVDYAKESSPEVCFGSPSSKWNYSIETASQQPDKTTEVTAVSEKINSQHTPAVETFHSFHIANIVPDLFKNKTVPIDDEKDSSENEMEIRNKHHEPKIDMDVENLGQDSKIPKDSHSTPNTINTTKLEEPVEKTCHKGIVSTAMFGLQDKEDVQSLNLDILSEEKANTESNNFDGIFGKRKPILSPGKPLAVSLIELDHSYGLAAPLELEPVLASVEEPEAFENDSKEPPLPGDRQLTESPVVDVITIDSALSRLDVPEPSPPQPRFPVRSFESDDELVYEFHRLGIDAEDCYYMKVGFDQLQQVGSESVIDAHWSSHTHILLINYVNTGWMTRHVCTI